MVRYLHQDFAHKVQVREVEVIMVEEISGAVVPDPEGAALAVNRGLLSKSQKWDS